MSQYNDSGFKGYVATAALGDGIIVKISSGEVIAATAGTDALLGVTVGTSAIGEVANVRLRSAQGTLKVKAGGEIAIGDMLTATTAGAAIATTTAGDHVLGMAIETGVSGDMVEVIPSLCKLAVAA